MLDDIQKDIHTLVRKAESSRMRLDRGTFKEPQLALK